MSSRGGSRWVRALVSGSAAAAALVASSAATEAASSQFDIAVAAGYHSAVKLGSWIPVTVDITNKGQQFDGQVQIDASTPFPGKGGPPAGVAVYQTPMSLAPGATKHLRTYLTEDYPGNIDVRIVGSGGAVVQSAQTSITTTVPGLLVAVLSDSPTALDSIATIHPGGVSPTVVHMSGADVPDSALILRAFDLIAVDDFSSDTLTAAQRSALLDYVMQGGSLLLGTGGSWHKTLAGLPAALVPMKVSGSSVLPQSQALGGVASVEVVTGSLADGAAAWSDEGGLPLLVESAIGAGYVEMATFDWAQGSIVAAGEADALLRQTVVRSTYGSPNALAASSLSGSKGGGFGNSVAFRGGSLTQALGNVPALDLPAWWLIGTLVFVYILLVGPVNYFVLRAVGRRAVAWITIPVIAIVASGSAYGATVVTKGTSVLANEIAIVHAQPGWDRAYNEQYTGIVTPTRGDFEIGVAGRGRMISPIDYFNNPGSANVGALRIDTATGTIAMQGMTAFTLRGFATEDIGAPVALDSTAELSGGQVKGTIRNSSSMTFTDGVVLSGGSYQKLGRLQPGGTLSFAVTPGTAMVLGPPPYMQIYPSNLCCSGPSGNSPEVERLNETRSSILSTVTNANFGPFIISAAPVIVLWTQHPFEQVTVNGARPREYVESAVVLNPPIAQ
ncbi:MAG TPA: hypothetical protein VGT01_05670, partial [Candidatus Dormibacteraeota bacterium]|nr:hypothetical protein [Candidatus Dormibacteraeota bacterium]